MGFAHVVYDSDGTVTALGLPPNRVTSVPADSGPDDHQGLTVARLALPSGLVSPWRVPLDRVRVDTSVEPHRLVVADDAGK